MEKNNNIEKVSFDEVIVIIYLLYLSFIETLVEYFPLLVYINTVFYFIPLLLYLRLFFTSKITNNNIIPFLIIVLSVISFGFSDISFSGFFNSFKWSCLSLFFLMWANKFEWNEHRVKRFVSLIKIIAVIHIPLSIFKMILFYSAGDDSYEMPLGLLGHSSTTYFVIIAMTIMLSSYLEGMLTLRKLLFYFLGFLICGISGGKRALILLIPISLLITNIIFSYSEKTFVILRRIFVSFIFFVIFAPFVIFLLAKFIPTLNPDRIVGGTFDLDYLQEYIEMHTSIEQMNQAGDATGRSSSTYIVLTNSIESPKIFLLGNGVGYFARKTGDDSILLSLGIEYGLNSFIWIMLQWGVIGLLLWFILLSSPVFVGYKLLKKTNSKFYKSIGLSMATIGLLMGPFQFYYSTIIKHFGIISIYYLLYGILNYISNNPKTSEIEQ